MTKYYIIIKYYKTSSGIIQEKVAPKIGDSQNYLTKKTQTTVEKKLNINPDSSTFSEPESPPETSLWTGASLNLVRS